MTNLIKRIENITSLIESFFKSYKMVLGGYTEVFKNPSSSEYRQAQKAVDPRLTIEGIPKVVRGIVSGRNVYIWRGDILHNDLRSKLPGKVDFQIDIIPRQGIHLRSYEKPMTKSIAKKLVKQIQSFALDVKNVDITVDGHDFYELDNLVKLGIFPSKK